MLRDPAGPQGAEAPAATPAGRPRPRVLLVDIDPVLRGLLQEWLGEAGYRPLDLAALEGAAPGASGAHKACEAHETCDLVLVNLPLPRRGGLDVLDRIERLLPGVPVLALSSNFFPGVAADGAVARALRVAGVLPLPATREQLLAQVRRLACRERQEGAA